MKHSPAIQMMCACVVFLAPSEGRPQGSFANLDFESPLLPLNPVFGLVPSANALPAWSAYLGGNVVTSVGYNVTALDAASTSLRYLDPNYPVIEGNYSVYLQSATIGVPQGYPTTAGIGQTGTIPSDAVSLFFVAGFGIPQVSFSGEMLQVVTVGTYSGYTVFGASIASYAGQSGDLLFSVTRGPTGTRQEVLLDAISFSSNPIPEPALPLAVRLWLAPTAWSLTATQTGCRTRGNNTRSLRQLVVTNQIDTVRTLEVAS